MDELIVLRYRVVGIPAKGDTREMCEVIQETCDVMRMPSAEIL